ncbi:hypothetical protein ACOYR4_13005 [Acidovorax sp. M14]|uniref:hypothetical protein n=1 Tax=Acidovorax sp. M14 TaxID=3411354 RepID=UPI003BF5F114
MKLQALSNGARFVLLRTGQRFEVLGRRNGYQMNVKRADGTEGRLHHSCFVKPIVKAGGAL